MAKKYSKKFGKRNIFVMENARIGIPKKMRCTPKKQIVSFIRIRIKNMLTFTQAKKGDIQKL